MLRVHPLHVRHIRGDNDREEEDHPPEGSDEEQDADDHPYAEELTTEEEEFCTNMAELKAEWERIKPQGAGMAEEVAWMQERYEQLARSTTDRYTSFITAGDEVMRAKELELSAWK